jgi:hypothetical protein
MTSSPVSLEDIKSIKLFVFRCMEVLAVLIVNILLGCIFVYGTIHYNLFVYGAIHYNLLLTPLSGGLSVYLGYWNFKQVNKLGRELLK